VDGRRELRLSTGEHTRRKRDATRVIAALARGFAAWTKENQHAIKDCHDPGGGIGG
jgi:hypothetical protein